MSKLDASKLHLMPLEFKSLEKYCSARSIASLKNSLRVLESGKAPTPTFPLYGKRDDSVLHGLLEILDSGNLPPWLIEYEYSRVSKWGQQGGVPKWDTLADLFELYQTALKDVKYVDNDIMLEMSNDYSKLHCTIRSVSDALDHLKRSNKIESRKAGWNTYEKKKTDPYAQKEAVYMAKSGNWRFGNGYTFARYNKLKPRLFMPMSYSSMLKQAQYFISFLGNIQLNLLQCKHNSPYVAWADKVGFEKCFEYMGFEVKNANIEPNERLLYFSNDFEKMDTRTGSSQYRNLFIPILRSAFGNQNTNDLVDAMMFTTTAPIYSPSGIMIGDHGTASGAEVTNGGESVCNDYFQRRFFKVLRRLAPKGWRLISRRFNGDDSAIIFALDITIWNIDKFFDCVKQALSIVCDETGFDIQFDKLDISDKFGRYCQNVYFYDTQSGTIKWMYPSVLALNSIVHPEHEYAKSEWDKDYRDLDIIEKLDNLINHPLYHIVVDYVRNGLKFPLLGKSESETERILSKYERYRELQTLGERYNRADYDIKMSPTVKYILSQR